jgi:hypothetical protein
LTIQISITADTAAQAREEIYSLLHGVTPAIVGLGSGPAISEHVADVPTAEDIPAPVVEEAPKAKRGRKPKAEVVAEPEVAPVQSISASPENRVDPEADEEDEDVDVPADEEEDDLVGGFAVTGEGLMAAMQAHAAKFGIEETQKHAADLFGAGFAKRTDVVAAGEDAVRGALRNFTRAIETGKAAG